MKTPFAVGERVYLRPLDEADLERCMKWINDPEILPLLGRNRPMSRSLEREWLLGQYKSDSTMSLAIALIEDGRHIGNTGLHAISPTHRSAEFGILIGEQDAWGNGYGPDAARVILGYGFDQLGLHRIQLHVFSFNERAQRAYRKIGFAEEGVQRESVFRNGAWHDTILMSMLESEWRRRE